MKEENPFEELSKMNKGELRKLFPKQSQKFAGEEPLSLLIKDKCLSEIKGKPISKSMENKLKEIGVIDAIIKQSKEDNKIRKGLSYKFMNWLSK